MELGIVLISLALYLFLGEKRIGPITLMLIQAPLVTLVINVELNLSTILFVTLSNVLMLIDLDRGKKTSPLILSSLVSIQMLLVFNRLENIFELFILVMGLELCTVLCNKKSESLKNFRLNLSGFYSYSIALIILLYLFLDIFNAGNSLKAISNDKGSMALIFSFILILITSSFFESIDKLNSIYSMSNFQVKVFIYTLKFLIIPFNVIIYLKQSIVTSSASYLNTSIVIFCGIVMVSFLIRLLRLNMKIENTLILQFNTLVTLTLYLIGSSNSDVHLFVALVVNLGSYYIFTHYRNKFTELIYVGIPFSPTFILNGSFISTSLPRFELLVAASMVIVLCFPFIVYPMFKQVSFDEAV